MAKTKLPSGTFLKGPRINPKAITGKERVAELIDNAFLAYNAGRLKEACHLFAGRMLKPNVTIGMSGAVADLARRAGAGQ